MREVSYLLVAGAALLTLFSIVMPEEQKGKISFDTLSSCQIKVEVERFAPSTYFKTFVCSDYSGMDNDCYRLVMHEGSCVKSYHYLKPEETVLSETAATEATPEPEKKPFGVEDEKYKPLNVDMTQTGASLWLTE